MRKTQSKHKSSLLKTKKDENQYADFLQKKLQEEQYLTHLVNIDVKTLQQQNNQLKQLVTKLRTGDKKLNKKITELQQDQEKFQNIISKLQEQNNFLSKKVQRMQSENQKQLNASEPLETKLVFKQFLANTFPTYKDTIKRILRFFMYIEKYEKNGKQERIKAYNEFVKSIVQKIMLFIFPKRTQNEKNNKIAETMVQKWKNKETFAEKQLRKELASLKILNSQYLMKIQSYEAQIIKLKAVKNMFDSKVQNYEKTLKVKASEFVVHFKKALIKKTEYGEQDEAIQQMKEILHTLQSVVSASGQHANNVSNEKVENRIQSNEFSMMSNKSLPDMEIPQQSKQNLQNQVSKKALKKHPILKKNIYGYYEEPQLSTQWNFLTNTKILDLNKYTQTLPDDLTILIAHPVIIIHLFDGDIRPKRTRHNTEFYVKIHKNSQSSIASQPVDSQDYKPVWNKQYIIKNYDYPSLKVQLLNKSKGLRDKVLGEGKLSVESTESKIVPIRKEKEYEGRVRFGLHYPKGNIFQFAINSIQLVVPQNVRILTETVQISANMNDSFVEKFSNSSLVKYLTNKSIFIIQGTNGDIQGRIVNRKISGTISFNEFTQKQGSKKVIIKAQDWEIILEGYIVLIVSEQNEPERIQSTQEGKYFAVRAGYPLVSATYNNCVLYSHVKFPLVFNYIDKITCLQCVMQQSQKIKGRTEESVIDPLTVPGTQNTLRSHQLLSTPPHIYEFFIETLEGPQVKFAYQSTLFVKLPDKVKLEIEMQVDQKDGQIEKLDPFMKKGKRKLRENEILKIQFFIETKDLMMNYYKILSRTYKVTGYSKYKLGYCKIKNLLRSQSQENKQQKLHKQIQRKQIIIDQPLQGEYYIKFCVSKGCFPSFSSTSKYSIQLSTENDCIKTEFTKGELLIWQHEILMKFKFGKDKSPTFTIKIIELPLIGDEKIIYDCKIPMTSNILKLGKLILNLSTDQYELQRKSLQQYDILILSNISIPQHVYSIYVDRIEIEVEQQADWFSKIDPYLLFFVNEKKVHQTIVQDGAGDNSQWENLDFKTVVSQKSNTQELGEMFKLKIYDQDLINDDYLGQCTLIFDSQIANSTGLIECIRSKVVKQDKVCGSVRVHGKFKKIKQNPQQILTHSFSQLASDSHLLYHICLTEINFTNTKFIQTEQKVKISHLCRKEYKNVCKQILYKDGLSLKDVNFSIWKTINIKESQDLMIEIRLTTERKSLFKKQSIDLGSIFIKKQLLKDINKVSQLNIEIICEGSKQVGCCSILVQPIYSSEYLVMDSYSSGTELKLKGRRENDCVSLQPSVRNNLNSLKEQFGDIYLFSDGQQYSLQIQDNKVRSIQTKAEQRVVVGSDSLKQVAYLKGQNSKYPFYNQCLTVYNFHKLSKSSHKPLVYNRQFAFNSPSTLQQYSKKNLTPKLFYIKILHWEPVKFESLLSHQISLKFANRGQCRITRRQNENFNECYVIGHKGNPSVLLFSSQIVPHQLVIHETDSHNNKNTFTVPLIQGQSMICTQKYTYFQHYGAIYYQLEEYKDKYRRLYLTKLLIKVYQPNMKSKEQSETISLKVSIEGSPLTYQSTKSIGNSGYLFENMQFYLPLQNLSNTVTLKFTTSNHNQQQSLTIQIQAKLNRWDYLYQQTSNYTLHAELIIQSDPNIISTQLSRPTLPTQISFIQLQSLSITPTANLHNNEVKIKFSLHNQLIELKAIRNQSNNDNFFYQIKQKQLLYIYQSQLAIIKVEIIQQKIFGDSIIGSGVIEIKKHQLNFGYTETFAEIINKQGVVLGKVEIGFKPLSEVSFLYVDVDRIVPCKEYKALTVELVPFGTDKRKIQKVKMQLYQQSPLSSQQQYALPFDLNYNTSQDLIVAQNDYQDYTVHISDSQTNQLLGKFKLCDLIKKGNDDHYQHIQVIHPLRITKLQLNGLIRVNYIESVSAKKELYHQQQTLNQQFIYFSLKDFKFIDQLSSPVISLLIQSQSGKLFTKEFNFSAQKQTPIISTTIRQQEKLTLFIRRQQQVALIAFAIIDIQTYMRDQTQLVMFQSYLQPQVVYALCKVDIKKVADNKILYEIVQVKARELTDMELFVDMNPYVVVQSISQVQNVENNKQTQSHEPSQTFFTEVNSGKTNLWWKLGLILQDSFKLTLFDKDLKFDDYIGQATILTQQLQKDFILNQNNQIQSTQLNHNRDKITKQMKLISVEDNNKDAGFVEVTMRRIVATSNQLNTIKQQTNQSKQQQGVYCVMVDGYCENIRLNGSKQQVTSFTISLQNGIVLYSLQVPYTSNCKNFNLIMNIITAGPILLSQFAFVDLNGVGNNQMLIIDVQIKGDKEQTKRFRQIITFRELFKTFLNRNMKFEESQSQLFGNCQLLSLRESILLQNNYDKQQPIYSSQQFGPVYLLNSVTVWLLYNQFSNNVMTISIVVYDKSLTKSRQYYLQLSPYQSKLLRTKQTCLILDLQKCLPYSIWLQSTDQLQIILTGNNPSQSIKTKLSFNNLNLSSNQHLNLNSNQHKTLMQSHLLQQQTKTTLGFLYLQLQSIYEKQPEEYSNLSTINSNPIIKNINTIKKSSSSWLEFKVKNATFYKDIELFSKMDPYYIADFTQFQQEDEQLKESFRSSVQQNVGTHPVWDDRFFFYLKSNKNKCQLSITFMDEQVIKDRPIGYSKIDTQEWFTSIKKGVTEREIKIFREQNKLSEQVGTAIISYNITHSYIIFLALQSLGNDYKLMIETIQEKESLDSIASKVQQLALMKSYPVSSQFSHLYISCGSQSKTILTKQLMGKDKSQGQLCFPQHSLVLKYMLFQ